MDNFTLLPSTPKTRTDVEPTGDSEIPERTATAMNEGGEGSQEDKTS